MQILHSAAAVRDELEVETTGKLGRYLPMLKLKSEYPSTTWSTSHSIIVFLEYIMEKRVKQKCMLLYRQDV